jgi:hypothetical protein
MWGDINKDESGKYLTTLKGKISCLKKEMEQIEKELIDMDKLNLEKKLRVFLVFICARLTSLRRKRP